MTEEIIKKFSCERCPKTKEIELKSGMWIVRNPKAPQGWEIRNSAQLCPNCVAKHDNGYKEWFANFMKEGKEGK